MSQKAPAPYITLKNGQQSIRSTLSYTYLCAVFPQIHWIAFTPSIDLAPEVHFLLQRAKLLKDCVIQNVHHKYAYDISEPDDFIPMPSAHELDQDPWILGCATCVL